MTRTVLAIAVIFVVIVGGWYWLTANENAAVAPVPAATTGDTSASQGFGETGTTQTPPASSGSSDSSTELVPGSTAAPIVGSNFMLGIDENNVLGTYLIGYNGMTLYTYEHDTGASSTCYYQCASTWPPYVVSPSDHPNFQYGVTGSKFGTVTRTDGTLQVTYSGHPLYFYSGDTTGESTLGQGLGGVWYVINP